MVKKMVNDVKSKNCLFDDVMVSYIYDEIPTVERRRFETHLVDCSVCSEEFAEISAARFSVFEWQKEAFAELPTPEIDIPYVRSRIEKIGFLEGLRELFSGLGIPLAAAATVVIFLGIGFAAFTLIGGFDQIAANLSPDETRIPAVVIPDQTVANVTAALTRKVDTDSSLVNKKIPVSRDLKPARAVLETRRLRPAKQLTAGNIDRFNRTPTQLKKAPVLSNYSEADDRSLRLTDLFDNEIGSIE